MKKLLLILLLIVGCASIGALTPDMKIYMNELKTRDITFMIVGVISYLPNAAGGVDVHILKRYTNNKSIKYIRYEVEPYNAVGDKVFSSIGNKGITWLKETGPVPPTETYPMIVDMSTFGTVWYNHSLSCMELLTVEVEYMDGDIERYGVDTGYEVDLYDSTKAITKLLAPKEHRIKDRWFCEEPFILRDPLTGKPF